MSILSSLSSVSDYLGDEKFTASAFDTLIKGSQSFVSLTGAVGIAGFKFDISDDEEVLLESDITDYITESGTPVQDNIVCKPIKVTLKGLVGEYVYTPSTSKSIFQKFSDKLQSATQKLITISSYLPTLSDFSKNTFETLKSSASDVSKAWDIGIDAFKTYREINIPTDNQSEAFLYFEALFNSRQTFTIQTPYRFYTDMAIERMRAIQHGDTRDTTEFEITFKKIQKVVTSELTSKTLQGRLESMNSRFKQIGETKGVETTLNTLKGDLI
jgi:hypothetical protein